MFLKVSYFINNLVFRFRKSSEFASTPLQVCNVQSYLIYAFIFAILVVAIDALSKR